MSVFSPFAFPEDIGRETLSTVRLTGAVYDFFGVPVQVEIEAGLNKRVTQYKNTFQLSGDPRSVESGVDGVWFMDLPDSFNMTPDSYYRIVINDQVLRKNLPDFPPEISLNELEDY
jgi:hypothetical protein